MSILSHHCVDKPKEYVGQAIDKDCKHPIVLCYCKQVLMGWPPLADSHVPQGMHKVLELQTNDIIGLRSEHFEHAGLGQ